MSSADSKPMMYDTAVKRLTDLVGEEAESVRVLRGPHVDLEVSFENRPTFVLAFKNRSDAATISLAIHQAKGYALDLSDAIPVIVVPYMWAAGRRLCEDANLNWFDLSGNAHLDLDGLHVHIEGKPNSFKRRGRPSSAFAPKSARIARWFLMHPDEHFHQHDLVRATGLSRGLVSRIVRRLKELNLVKLSKQGALSLRDFDAMLDAWGEEYKFSKHRLIRGHVAARTGNAVLRQLVAGFEKAQIPYAATGLCAAWQYSEFTGFRLATLYVGQQPDLGVLKGVGFYEEKVGENVWLVVPNDEGVFHGAQSMMGIHCVHPVQVYLDLIQQPERSNEAAERLRDEFLKGKTDA